MDSPIFSCFLEPVLCEKYTDIKFKNYLKRVEIDLSHFVGGSVSLPLLY